MTYHYTYSINKLSTTLELYFLSFELVDQLTNEIREKQLPGCYQKTVSLTPTKTLSPTPWFDSLVLIRSPSLSVRPLLDHRIVPITQEWLAFPCSYQLSL